MPCPSIASVSRLTPDEVVQDVGELVDPVGRPDRRVDHESPVTATPNASATLALMLAAASGSGTVPLMAMPEPVRPRCSVGVVSRGRRRGPDRRGHDVGPSDAFDAFDDQLGLAEVVGRAAAQLGLATVERDPHALEVGGAQGALGLGLQVVGGRS